MSRTVSRRWILKSLPVLGLSGAVAVSPGFTAARRARLLVIGGGFGGATAARYARRLLPQLSVTLIEPNRQYTACPFSNLVLGGLRSMSAQTFTYAALAEEGIEVVPQAATDVDPVKRTVTLAGGRSLSYDRLILAPGIDFRWDDLNGYTREASTRMPHAWKAGPQTELLGDQLRAMDNGGVVAISVTAAPFRCPPGPYERASLVAQYLQVHKPRSKLIVLDSNDRFSKQPLFLQAWEQHYGDMLEWRSASNDGRVVRVDPGSMTLHTDFGALQADVANIVPPQQAALIAQRAGTTDSSGWCPVNAMSFESRLQPGVHIIGDATIAAPMPKSAFSANAQAKVCAIAVARLFAGLDAEATTLANTCYSFVAADEAISVSGVYRSDNATFANVAGAGGTSAPGAPVALRQREAAQARDWFSAITSETFL